MRTTLRIVLCVSLLLGLSAFAQNSGPASNGQFNFGLSGASGAIQFDARSFGSSARGQMTFSATIDVSDEDTDGSGPSTSSGAAPAAVTLTVDIDCLKITGNRAAMSGVVTSSSRPGAVGSRAILAVEDGGEGKNADPDKFTWGVYGASTMNWTPSDSEVPGDAGWNFSWTATDSERPDDVGVPARQSSTVDCKSFGLGAYALESLPLGAGNIHVKQ
jgi:hypothetical protein